MEYGAPTPDPADGIGGYNSPMSRNKSPDEFSDDSMDGPLDKAIKMNPSRFNLMLPSSIPGRYKSIPQNTELPQCVMSSEDPATPPLDSGQESDADSDLERRLANEWQESDDDEGESRRNLSSDEEEEDSPSASNMAKHVIIKSKPFPKQITRWQVPNDGAQEFENMWASESEATNADRVSTDTSETESDDEGNDDYDEINDRDYAKDEKPMVNTREVEVKKTTREKVTETDAASSGSKPESILCFDEYGNLTTYRPSIPAPKTTPPPLPPPVKAPQFFSSPTSSVPAVPPPSKLNFDKISNKDFLEAAATLESDMDNSLKSRNNDRKKEDAPKIESPSNEAKPLKNRSPKLTENAEANVSDQELKQAFKEEFLTAATSRYGRARKRKTEDGFFFGTLNFNELRKITSTSPKKCKGTPGQMKVSPEQKAKNSKPDYKLRANLGETMNDVHNSPSSSTEMGDYNYKSDDSFSNKHELPVDSDNAKVQNSFNNMAKSPCHNGSAIQGKSSKGSKKSEEKAASKKESSKSHHKSKSPSVKKEVKPESPELSRHDSFFDLPKEELKTSLEDDVAKIKQAVKNKRLSLPRRDELELLRDRQVPVHISSERMLRRRSDVWKIKNSLQPPKRLSLNKKRGDRNSESSNLEFDENSLLDIPNESSTKKSSPKEVKEDLKSPIKPKLLIPNLKKKEKQDLNQVKSPKAENISSSEANDTQDSPTRRLRSEASSAVSKVASNSSSDVTESSVSASTKPAKSAVTPSDTLESKENILQTPSNATSRRNPRVKTEATPIANIKEEECGSITKSGRTVRKPQLMDVSIEAKKQKLDQIKNKELLGSGVIGELPVGVNHSVLEKEHPCEYMVGDLLWVSLKGNPLWPAMVSYQPDTGEFTRLSVRHSWQGRFSCCRLYFVRFFNDNSQTYWIGANSSLPFEGYLKLKDYLEDLKLKVKTLKSYRKPTAEGMLKTLVHIKKIDTASSAQKSERWLTAIEEGERAMTLEKYERLQIYNLKSEEKKPIKTTDSKKAPPRKLSLKKKHKIGRPRKIKVKPKGRPRKVLQAVKSSDECLTTDAEFSGFDENYSSDENRNVSNMISEISSGNKPSFAQYASKHLQKFILENPNISETAARTKLRWRWKKISQSQAAKRKLKASLKEEGKEQQTSVGSTLKRKHRNSVEKDTLVEDGEGTTAKRKRLEEKDPNKGVYKVVRNEKVCQMCEGVSNENGADMVRCKGLCCGIFHLTCAGLDSLTKIDFKCLECQTGDHQCFLCKSTEGVRQRCTVPFCGKFYHDECVQKWPQVSKNRHQEKFVCPRHVCHMCAANADDMNDPMARNPQFTRCLRCPTTYHTGEECIAAGCEEISSNHHICTKHLKIPKNNLHHVNVSWCFCCSKGGSLLLCDQCPAAFHAECMKITTPEGSYVCEDCENGKFPAYGDVVWVKLGLYRWWPGQVLHPRYIPDNIENLPHQQGMFCVHFFGSNDYYWVTRGRAFHYQEGDKGSRAASSKTLEQQFQRAIQEALEAYREHKERKTALEAVRSVKGKLKPPPYVKIDSNRPVGNVRLNKVDLAAANRCECDPFSENPCGDDEKCLNRMLMFECVREACGSKEKCGNQRFQKRQFANVASFRTEERGWGLKTLEDIKKGDFVIEYVGELIDDEEFHRRIEDMHKVKEENYYFLTIDKDIMIDAGPKGNLARFMNHSCEPNCETQKWTVGGDTRVGLFALMDIPANSELTFNYNLQCVGTEKKKCNCRAPKCSGFIGAKVQKNIEPNGSKKEKLVKRKRKRKRREIKISEDECYRCGGSGDLILCDVTDCPKSYHLQCLSLNKLPKGKWICPWHHCDECGQRSIRPNRCDYCPNSFCRSHMPGNLQIVAGVGNVCNDHSTEEIETLKGIMEAKVGAGMNMDYEDVESMDSENVEMNNGFEGDDVPNDSDVDSSSTCTYKNSLPESVSESILHQDQAEDSSDSQSSVIAPLKKRDKKTSLNRLSKTNDGYENNSSVINVNGPSCLSRSKPASNPKNGIKSRRTSVV